MSEISWEPAKVIEDLAEQIKQLSLNNTLLRSMVTQAKARISELESALEMGQQANSGNTDV